MGQGSGTNIVTTGTKRCPYCGEEINVTATKCRYCGEWLAKNVTKPSEQKVEEIQDKDMTAADVMDITASGLGCVWALVKMCYLYCCSFMHTTQSLTFRNTRRKWLMKL